MLKAIQNNPYRFLGVYSNSSARDRLGNERRLNAYIGRREVEFPTDLPSLLQKYDRTKEDLEQAKSAINLPADQLKHALLWFINSSPIDKMALEYLINGDTSKAMELFGKKETFSSLINKGVLSFIMGDEGTGIACLTKVIHTAEYLKQFASTVCGNTFVISADEASALFLEVLQKELPLSRLLKLYETYGYSKDDIAVLRSNAIGEPIAAINSAISEAKNVPSKNANAQYNAGMKLTNETKGHLATVKGMLSPSDMQWQMISDNLAKQILQCGINYYNNTNEDDDVSIDKALKLQAYAQSIAVGKLTKDRCDENVNILKKKKAELPPSEVKHQVKAIHYELSKYCKLPDKICHAVILLSNTKSHLQYMKEKLGGTNTLYLKLSTLVVSNALHNVIEEVNAVQNDPMIKMKAELGLGLDASDLNQIKSTLREAWNATKLMDAFDVEDGFKKRYDSNRKALKNMCEQLGISTYTHSVSPQFITKPVEPKKTTTKPHTPTTNSTSASNEKGSGKKEKDSSVITGCLWLLGIYVACSVVIGLICMALGGYFETGFVIAGIIAYFLL